MSHFLDNTAGCIMTLELKYAKLKWSYRHQSHVYAHVTNLCHTAAAAAEQMWTMFWRCIIEVAGLYTVLCNQTKSREFRLVLLGIELLLNPKSTCWTNICVSLQSLPLTCSLTNDQETIMIVWWVLVTLYWVFFYIEAQCGVLGQTLWIQLKISSWWVTFEVSIIVLDSYLFEFLIGVMGIMFHESDTWAVLSHLWLILGTLTGDLKIYHLEIIP